MLNKLWTICTLLKQWRKKKLMSCLSWWSHTPTVTLLFWPQPTRTDSSKRPSRRTVVLTLSLAEKMFSQERLILCQRLPPLTTASARDFSQWYHQKPANSVQKNDHLLTYPALYFLISITATLSVLMPSSSTPSQYFFINRWTTSFLWSLAALTAYSFTYLSFFCFRWYYWLIFWVCLKECALLARVSCILSIRCTFTISSSRYFYFSSRLFFSYSYCFSSFYMLLADDFCDIFALSKSFTPLES